ncbi:hypothetical protein PYCCODRAFT_1439709 [Trametes coccinea BRFM310]|uniref:Uncharacterized protein n=1 Tax=Trametes coccinea (strain BRFM310) TaxID=1353009 RepID=A0A1Y2IA94_TRAC3|nr:hypothetical protein PYCCODRAFT_1439709 [Trametes coccinea BRFM310]
MQPCVGNRPRWLLIWLRSCTAEHSIHAAKSSLRKRLFGHLSLLIPRNLQSEFDVT